MNIKDKVIVKLTDKGKEIYWSQEEFISLTFEQILCNFGYEHRIGNKCFEDDFEVVHMEDANVYFLNQYFKKEELADGKNTEARISACERLTRELNVSDMLEAIDNSSTPEALRIELEEAFKTGNVNLTGRAFMNIVSWYWTPIFIQQELEKED